MNGTNRIQMPIRIRCRQMVPADVAACCLHYDERAAQRWTANALRRELRQQHVVGLVAETMRRHRVLGHALIGLHERALQLVTLAVQPGHRRRQIGYRLIESIASRLQWQQRNEIVGYVRESALEAQLFLRACNFRATSVVRGFYSSAGDTGEDAYRFVHAKGAQQ